MKDPIERQEAIDAICKSECGSGFCGIPCPEVNVLKALPSAQPEIAKRTAETAQNVSDEDLISRKAAMNRIDEALVHVFVDSRGCGESVLRKLPSVEAIPVEWIENKIARFKAMDNAFASLTASQLQALLNDWRAEQNEG